MAIGRIVDMGGPQAGDVVRVEDYDHADTEVEYVRPVRPEPCFECCGRTWVVTGEPGGDLYWHDDAQCWTWLRLEPCPRCGGTGTERVPWRTVPSSQLLGRYDAPEGRPLTPNGGEVWSGELEHPIDSILRGALVGGEVEFTITVGESDEHSTNGDDLRRLDEVIAEHERAIIATAPSRRQR